MQTFLVARRDYMSVSPSVRQSVGKLLVTLLLFGLLGATYAVYTALLKDNSAIDNPNFKTKRRKEKPQNLAPFLSHFTWKNEYPRAANIIVHNQRSVISVKPTDIGLKYRDEILKS